VTTKGITRPVIATGTAIEPIKVIHSDRQEAERFGIDLSLTIDRREFGGDFDNSLPSGILNLGWHVHVDAALELIRSAAE
jgi:hypothetical protein